MKKIIKASLLLGMTLMVSCQQNSIYTEIDTDYVRSSTIEFNNYLSRMTRASKVNGDNSFVAGDTMGVWGVQKTGDQVDHIFINQPVRYVSGTTWTYSTGFAPKTLGYLFPHLRHNAFTEGKSSLSLPPSFAFGESHLPPQREARRLRIHAGEIALAVFLRDSVVDQIVPLLVRVDAVAGDQPLVMPILQKHRTDVDQLDVQLLGELDDLEVIHR